MGSPASSRRRRARRLHDLLVRDLAAARWTVGSCITAVFVFWKSPHSQGLIEAADALLPFAIGRTVDYSDLIALPVVSLRAATSHRLPLVDVGKIGVWLTAGLCLFAFTATSKVGPQLCLADVRRRDSGDGAQPGGHRSGLFAAARRIGVSTRPLRSGRCTGPLSEGRTSRGQGLLTLAAGFDAARQSSAVRGSVRWVPPRRRSTESPVRGRPCEGRDRAGTEATLSRGLFRRMEVPRPARPSW